MAEREAAHRHERDNALLALQGESHQSDSKLRKSGQRCAFIIALFGLALAATIVLVKTSWPSGMAASVIGGTPLIGIVVAFLGKPRDSEKPETK